MNNKNIVKKGVKTMGEIKKVAEEMLANDFISLGYIEQAESLEKEAFKINFKPILGKGKGLMGRMKTFYGKAKKFPAKHYNKATTYTTSTTNKLRDIVTGRRGRKAQAIAIGTGGLGLAGAGYGGYNILKKK